METSGRQEDAQHALRIIRVQAVRHLLAAVETWALAWSYSTKLTGTIPQYTLEEFRAARREVHLVSRYVFALESARSLAYAAGMAEQESPQVGIVDAMWEAVRNARQDLAEVISQIAATHATVQTAAQARHEIVAQTVQAENAEIDAWEALAAANQTAVLAIEAEDVDQGRNFEKGACAQLDKAQEEAEQASDAVAQAYMSVSLEPLQRFVRNAAVEHIHALAAQGAVPAASQAIAETELDPAVRQQLLDYPQDLDPLFETLITNTQQTVTAYENLESAAHVAAASFITTVTNLGLALADPLPALEVHSTSGEEDSASSEEDD